MSDDLEALRAQLRDAQALLLAVDAALGAVQTAYELALTNVERLRDLVAEAEARRPRE